MSNRAGGPPARRPPQAFPQQQVAPTHTRVSVSPLPLPEELAAYNTIAPTLVDRIVTMAEEEGAHRRELERRQVIGAVRRGYIGQIFGLVIGLAGMAVAGLLGYHGQTWVATLIATLDIVGLVSIFALAGRRPAAPPPEQNPQLPLPGIGGPPQIQAPK